LLENGGIFVEDSTISNRHAVLSWSFRGDQSLVVVQDCGSKNGTMINEQMLSPGAMHLLTDGDSVYIGCSVEIKFFLGFPQTRQTVAV
jgi:pSer/pThr/pTyr-binding forkhead associated (FHA) protein